MIDDHNRLLELSGRLQTIYGTFLLIFFAQISIIVSLISFQLAATESFLVAVPFLVLTLNDALIFCHYGQKLHDSSLRVYDGIYESNWYEIRDLKIMRNIQFIILRSQKPKVLQARGFAIIKLNTFMGVSFY